MSSPRLRIGQLLVDARLITAAALDEVLVAQRTDGRRLGTLLVERGLINETQLTQILSHQLSVPWVSLLHIEFSRQLLNLVPREVADRFCLVPIYVRHVRNQGDTLYVAMDDPSNEEGLRACRDHSGLPVRSMIAPPTDIRSAIRVYYGVGPKVDEPQAPPPPPRPAPPPPAPVAKPVAVQDGAANGPKPKGPPPVPPPAPAPVAVAPLHAEIEDEPTLVLPIKPVTSPPPPAPRSSPPVPAPKSPRQPQPAVDGPVIEAVEITVDRSRAERLRNILEPPSTPAPPSSSPDVESIPRPRGRTPRMVSLTLLDGTTINLPAKKRGRERPGSGEDSPAPRAPASTSEPPGIEDSVQGLTARDLVLALRVAANGADASEVLGPNMRWEALFSALLSLMLKKHLIADWEFIDELKKQL